MNPPFGNYSFPSVSSFVFPGNTSRNTSSSSSTSPVVPPFSGKISRRSKSRTLCIDTRKKPPLASPLLFSEVVPEQGKNIPSLSPFSTPKTRAMMDCVNQDMSDLDLDTQPMDVPLSSRQNRSVSNFDSTGPIPLGRHNRAFSNFDISCMNLSILQNSHVDVSRPSILSPPSSSTPSNPSPVLRPVADHFFEEDDHHDVNDDTDDDTDDDDDDDDDCEEKLIPTAESSPVLQNLDHPSEKLPIRCGSVACMITRSSSDPDLESCQSPAKIPRIDDSFMALSQSEIKTVAPVPLCQMNRGRFGGIFCKSASCLPTPDFTPPVDEYKEEDFYGLKIPVKTGAKTHKRISRETAAAFIRRELVPPKGFELVVWDARFPFEFVGGHIKGADNKTYPNLRQKVDDFVREARRMDKRYLILCYCQFSSARAPKLLDILRVAETDIMLEERKDRSTLVSTEDSRFLPFLIDGGYDNFYSGFSEKRFAYFGRSEEQHEYCEGGKYVRETDDQIDGRRCRSEYEDDIIGACNSRVLSDRWKQDDLTHQRSQSMGQCGPRATIKKVRSFCFSEGFSIRSCNVDSENEDESNNADSQETTGSMDDDMSIDVCDDEPVLSSMSRATSERSL